VTATPILVLLWLGVGVCVAAALGMLLVRDPADRVHLTAPLNTVGAPLVAVALALDTGWGRQAVKIVLIGLLLLGTGAVLSAATGQAMRSGEPTGDPYSPGQEPEAVHD
jgi:multisubunit Na+/H+ antiporter MnhG subunit